MKKITLNEALVYMKQLKERRAEIVNLREENAYKTERVLGDKVVNIKTPVYNLKDLDTLINNLSREIRLLDAAIKATNAKVLVEGYEQDESVMGNIA